MTDTAFDPNERYKVGKIISKYDLQEFHAELPDRWLGEGRDAQSLRDLADELNVAILRKAMESANLEPLDGEVENTYRLLTEEEVSSGMRTAKRNQLEREGIDVESVEDDFVTHQAIYTYLTDVLDVSKQDQENRDPIEKHSERINRLRSRTEAVANNSIDSLVADGDLEVVDPEISVNIQVYCHQCNRQYPLSSLLAQRV
ncbi:rod-determining factor RdfA [Haloplanus litoreus]|uniref:rod-determining factor RdfA n=1 Tax=Haloplanus litoreus TaxID=767515 RepID=UPI003609AB3A